MEKDGMPQAEELLVTPQFLVERPQNTSGSHPPLFHAIILTLRPLPWSVLPLSALWYCLAIS